MRQELRDIVLFAAHDLLKDPPFSRVDLISCRNVLIYLDRELQEQVCEHVPLRAQAGRLSVLGASETRRQSDRAVPQLDRKRAPVPIDRRGWRQAAPVPRLLGPVRVREHRRAAAPRAESRPRR